MRHIYVYACLISAYEQFAYVAFDGHVSCWNIYGNIVINKFLIFLLFRSAELGEIISRNRVQSDPRKLHALDKLSHHYNKKICMRRVTSTLTYMSYVSLFAKGLNMTN